MNEIDKQFQVTLTDAELLKQIPIADYDDLLEKGTAPDSYRPTLFDVLSHNAIDFYASGEQAGNMKTDEFDLTADGPIFGPVNEFVDWKPDTKDQSSLTLRAIVLYQQLLQFLGSNS